MSRWMTLLLLTTGCASSHSHSVDRRAMDHHFAEPEKFAAAWNDPSRDAWQKPEEIVAALGLVSGGAVADLGAGTGYLVEPLRDAVGNEGSVVAVDVSPEMIAFLDRRIESAGWRNVATHRGAPNDPGLKASSLDGVVTLNTWHHVEKRVAFATKLRESLRDGGRLVVVDFLAEPTEGKGPPLEMRLPASTVVEELRAAGFNAEVLEETLPRHYIVVGSK